MYFTCVVAGSLHRLQVAIVRLSWFLQLSLPSFGQLLCPSQHFIHSLLTTLHSTSFAAHHFASVHGRPSLHCEERTDEANTACLHAISQSQRYNTHRVPFRSVRSLLHFSPALSTRCPLFCSPTVPISAACECYLLMSYPPFRP